MCLPRKLRWEVTREWLRRISSSLCLYMVQPTIHHKYILQVWQIHLVILTNTIWNCWGGLALDYGYTWYSLFTTNPPVAYSWQGFSNDDSQSEVMHSVDSSPPWRFHSLCVWWPPNPRKWLLHGIKVHILTTILSCNSNSRRSHFKTHKISDKHIHPSFNLPSCGVAFDIT